MRSLTREQALALGASAAAGVAYAAVPYSLATDLVLYNGTLLLALAAASLAAWRLRRIRPRPWVLLAVSLAASLVGELLWLYYSAIGQDPYPSVADVVFLAGYIPLGAAAASMVATPRGGARDRFLWLDSLILTTVAGALIWVVVLGPYSANPELDWMTKVASIAYPMADVFVLGFVIRLVLARHGQTRATALFTVGIAMLLIADTAYSYLELTGGYTPGSSLDFAWLMSYVLMGVAALDRSAALPSVVAPDHGLGRGRLAVVLCAIAAPQLLLLHSLGERGMIGRNLPAEAAIAGAVTSLLVGVRFWSLLRHVRQLESRRSAERLSAVVDHLSDAVLLLDADATITYASPAVGMWGKDPRSSLGEPLASWMVGTDQPGLARQLVALAESPPGTTVEMHGQLAGVDGEVHAVEGVLQNLLQDDAVTAIIVTLTDVTRRQELEAQLRRKAFHDDLTGLANRDLFSDRLEHALRRAHRLDALGVAVVFVDLDDFKAVNDGLGHGAGDELLRHVGERIRLCVRPADTIARLGGDEFAILLEDLTDIDEAGAVAHRVLEMLSLPVRVLDSDIAVPASIGVAPRTLDCTAESLLRDADIAMYSAKAFGKGRVEIFDDTLRLAAQRRLQLRIDLPAALATGQLRVVYQPLHQVSDNQLTGFEALLRWEHPEHGAIMPVDFIPAAEGSGFIVELGRYVLFEACVQAARWNRLSATPLTMNVNVSGVQLQHPGFTEAVAESLQLTELNPAMLTLELTESVLIDHDRIGDALTALRELGVGIAIDDFGTGYSSLSYLHQFPITAVKIDRSFVSQVDNPADANLVRSVLGIAEALGLKAVAEGVESPEQLAALGLLGCPIAQGFYLGEPQSPTDIDRLLGAIIAAAGPPLLGRQPTQPPSARVAG